MSLGSPFFSRLVLKRTLLRWSDRYRHRQYLQIHAGWYVIRIYGQRDGANETQDSRETAIDCLLLGAIRKFKSIRRNVTATDAYYGNHLRITLLIFIRFIDVEDGNPYGQNYTAIVLSIADVIFVHVSFRTNLFSLNCIIYVNKLSHF